MNRREGKSQFMTYNWSIFIPYIRTQEETT